MNHLGGVIVIFENDVRLVLFFDIGVIFEWLISFIDDIDDDQNSNYIIEYVLIAIGIPTAKPMIRPVLDDDSSVEVVVTPLVTTLEDVTVNTPPMVPLDDAALAKLLLELEAEEAVVDEVEPVPDVTTEPRPM